MFVVTVVFEVAVEDAPAFLIRVRQQAQDSLDREPGCHRFDVAVAAESPERIFLYELYDDADAFAAHLATDHFKAFDAEVATMVRTKSVQTWNLA